MPIDDDYEKIKNEIISERVAETIKKDPEHWADRLEDIGFSWKDDSYGDQEGQEEKRAKPENINQEFLAGYFDGHIKLSDAVLKAFSDERNADNPNYPLFRKYFKSGNERLKQLLLYGLAKNTTDTDLLNDLTFFHEFRNMLSMLIRLYLKACEEEQDIDRFKEIAEDFYYAVEPDGYDALQELEQRFPSDSAKGEVVRKLIQDQLSEPEDIQF
ncbi:MAG: hypothetical protein B6I22_14305 [Desulfobacteraceae bacterium 4572_123]|nr:MAG: hypothetical protein B6I22_14305 [Desulfobacteraceae bacterium 4572_123]